MRLPPNEQGKELRRLLLHVESGQATGKQLSLTGVSQASVDFAIAQGLIYYDSKTGKWLPTDEGTLSIGH